MLRKVSPIVSSSDQREQQRMQERLFAFIARYMPLTDAEKEAISGMDIFRSYKKGALMLREGEVSREEYFVLKGCLRSYRSLDGEEKTTGLYTELDAVTPLRDPVRSTAVHAIACLENSIVCATTPGMERAVVERFPRFETLCRILSEDLLAKTRATFSEYVCATPEERYLDLVKNRPDLVQRVPQYHLASYLGIRPQSLSRIRKRLAAGASR